MSSQSSETRSKASSAQSNFSITPTSTPPTRTLAPPTLTSNASISHREYIYLLPYPLPPGTPIPYTLTLPSSNPLNLPPHPFEPTSTLVLTTPTRTFIDLRFLRPLSPADPALPNPGSAHRLDWAFAGTSTSTPLPPTDPSAHPTLPTARAEWSHWLDSRCPPGAGASPPPDTGVVFTLPDGRALEHGYAPDAGGVERSHEEMWRDEEVESTSKAGTRVCAVLRCADYEAGVRGVVVRLGQFVQGLLCGPEGVTCERWEFGGRVEGEEEEEDEEGEDEEGESRLWERTARVGNGFVPCAVLMRPSLLVLGGEVRYGSVLWRVEELWEWA